MVNARILLFFLVLIITCDKAIASPKPKITGDISSPECVDAFRLATSMFNSKASTLYAPLVIPHNMHSELILGASDVDISGGDALNASEEFFERIPQPEESSLRNIYWEKLPFGNIRIAVQETPSGWRGDRYSLYTLDKNIEKNAPLKESRKNYSKSEPTALVPDTWRPPLVFHLHSSKKLWFITVGEPYQILADWSVFKKSKNGLFEEACTIRFHPAITSGTNLLPESTQKFARLLDTTIGPGLNEGTLHPTAFLRIRAQQIWANAAIRPWALADSDPYNTTDEVRAGLASWAQNGTSYHRTYQDILKSYPIAEKALSDHYMRQFNLPKAKANRMAQWALDIAFRGNYIFSSGQGYFRSERINTNPWPAK